MFTTLLGGLPRPPDASSPDAAVRAAIEAQVEAGIDLLTDGRLPGELLGARGELRSPGEVVEWWQHASRAAAGLPVKQALPGPYSSRRDRAASLAFAARLRAIVVALAGAGCPLIEIAEPGAPAIDADPDERARFRECHLALLDGIDGAHLSLAITGGNADTAGIETILAAPYQSLAVDLIDGPDNWRLLRDVPGDRGVVCGALSPHAQSDDGPELLLWAVAYASGMEARGEARVGLATAGSLASLSWEQAVRKLQRLGDAGRIAGLPPTEAERHLDPRSLGKRQAALGHTPRPPRRGATHG